MFRKVFTVFLIICGSISATAMMPMLLREGTFWSTPFMSKYADLLHERVFITLDEAFNDAQFTIEYRIRVNQNGVQIPMLFYHSDNDSTLEVSVDNKTVFLHRVYADYDKTDSAKLSGFDYFQGLDVNNKDLIEKTDSVEFFVISDFLYYFKENLAQGEHIVKVKCTAHQRMDGHSLVRQRSFRYFLVPAKFRNLHDGLEINLDASRVKGAIATNLGTPVRGDLNGVAVWSFSSLPQEMIEILYVPQISLVARALVMITPWGLAVICALLLIVLHVFAIWRFRRTYFKRRYSWVMIVGGILVPGLAGLCLVLSYYLTNAAIGEEAGENSPFVVAFISALFYPYILVVYWPAMWVIDRIITVRLRARHQ